MGLRARTRVLLCILVASMGLAAEQAEAHLPGGAFCSKLPAKSELACARKDLWHARGVVRWVKSHRLLTVESPDRQVAVQFRAVLNDHLWLIREAKRWEREARARLAPPAPIIAHAALWACITNGAYPGAAHEGDGYNGAYTGPLGMTTPWEGYYPTGGDWVHTPVAVVYADAEKAFAAHGYSTAWLYGQWPQTSPPCVGR